MEKAGFVTLVIEDEHGIRVRNLISETAFLAGNNIVYWDGLDDLGRTPSSVTGKLVKPGKYVVRGLVRPEIEARYEMSVYSHGKPPWYTGEKSSEWLTNHTPPSAILWVPEKNAPQRGGKSIAGGQMLAGSWVSEGGSGLAWMDTLGNKLWGQGWVGGAWTGVTQLARDAGSNPVEGTYAYAAVAWDDELRLTELLPKSQGGGGDARMGTGEDRPLLKPTWKFPAGTPDLTDKGYGAQRGIAGLAVHNGLIIASLPVTSKLLFVDARAHKPLGTASINDPRGVAFDSRGRLLVISGTRLIRYTLSADPTKLAKPELVITKNLEDPQRVTLDAQSNIFISDLGNSHQVKMFAPDGRYIRSIGRGGKPQPGLYDPNHMNNPAGISIDGLNRLWVAENDFTPKRLSVWTREGKLVNAFYGPSQYGGGGELDPRDRNLFHYAGEGGGMTFELDWKARTDRLTNVYSRGDWNPANLPQGAIGSTQPQTVFYHNGRQHLTNVFNNNPTGGAEAGFLWTMEKNVAVPRAGFGSVSGWGVLAWALPNYNKYFYVRWTGQISPRYSQTYKFSTITDDGVRLWIGDKKLIDHWEEKGLSKDSGTVTLEAGKRYDITMEFYQNQSGAQAHLFWESPGQPREIVPSSRLYPTPEAKQPGGITGHYFAGSVYGDLRGTSHNVRRVDPNIDFDWINTGPAPLESANAAAFRTRLPKAYRRGDQLTFTWSDLNGDAQVQPAEVDFSIAEEGPGGITIMHDLSFIAGRLNNKAMRFAPISIDAKGTPKYDLSSGKVLAEGAQHPVSSGGDQVIQATNGWTVLTNAPKPFSAHGVGGAQNGVVKWSYPSVWHGLHASHEAPLPEHPGQLLGTTRLLGNFVTPKNSDAGPLWALNGNKGNVYLFTADGLFVTTLFKDSRLASFNAPDQQHNRKMNDYSLQEESFWPSISQTADGNIYLTAGTSSIMRLDSLEGIRRLPPSVLTVSAGMLENAQAYFVQRESARQQAQKQGPLSVSMVNLAPVPDGYLTEWKDTDFVSIDKHSSAALAISGDRLFAAWKTDDATLLNNTPESLANLFKTGGGLDLMLGNVEGGQRLLVARIDGKPTAMLYRRQDAEARGEPTKFISGLGINKTTTIDRVENVSAQIVLGQDGKNYELSVPLSLLRLLPQAGQSITGDIGILRGNGFQTMQRLYWNNKSTGLTSDLASEAELTPLLWGTFVFKTDH
ncbi:MAG TPA: PA14 domain-containing protein [Pedobacter sp.]|nr:PA14 domain-containing protein [Pedobacter sp.]